MDDIIRAVSDRMPKFNDFTLKGFVKQSVNNSHKFVDVCYREATKLNGGALTYVGYRILSPEERLSVELSWSKKPKISLARSDMRLVAYHLSHDGNPQDPAYLYTPYMFHNFLQVKGKRYAITLGICEKTFARIVDKTTDGIMIRAIRAPIPFNRKSRFRVDSITGEFLASEYIITCKLHQKRHGKRKRDTTNFLYLAARFGFDDAVSRFGLTREDISFVEQPDMYDGEHHYIHCRPETVTNKNLYLKVRKEVFEIPVNRKLICNIIYLVTGFEFPTINEMHDPTGSIWRIMLGKIIYPEATIPIARSNADTHLASVDISIDPISRARYNDFGVPVNDIYDLLVYVIDHIDSLMVNTLSQDLYTKRIDVMDGLLIMPFATTIFLKFYATNQRAVLRESEVRSLLKIRPWTIDAAWSSSQRGLVQNVTTGAQIFNGNWLSSFGIQKNRADGTAEQRFHPSMAVVESITSFSGRDVGRTGFINPYLEIEPNGGVVRPDYADQIESLEAYLPRN